jgi:hypothetical protein
MDCRGEGAVGRLKPARDICVVHALPMEIHAHLAPGGGEEQRDVLHVVLELVEACGVRLPIVDLP